MSSSKQPQELLQPLHWRAAIKQYDPTQKLTPKQLELLTEAARLAPTSYGIQPIKLVVVENQATKEKLHQAGYQQPQFLDASHILVFAARTQVTGDDVEAYVDRIIEQRQATSESLEDYKNMMLNTVHHMDEESSHAWAAKQAYLAVGMTLAVAAQAKIDTSPMEGFDADAFDEILGLQGAGYHAVTVVAAGFRSPEDKYSDMPKVRKSEDDFTTWVN